MLLAGWAKIATRASIGSVRCEAPAASMRWQKCPKIRSLLAGRRSKANSGHLDGMCAGGDGPANNDPCIHQQPRSGIPIHEQHQMKSQFLPLSCRFCVRSPHPMMPPLSCLVLALLADFSKLEPTMVVDMVLEYKLAQELRPRDDIACTAGACECQIGWL